MGAVGFRRAWQGPSPGCLPTRHDQGRINLPTTIERLLDSVDWTLIQHDKIPDSDLPYVTHTGHIYIGPFRLDCVILSDGRRIFTEDSVTRLLGGGE